MRISDWSSDVCSSDLAAQAPGNADVLRGNGFGVGDAGVEVDQCFLRLSVVIQLESEIAEWAGLVLVRLRVDPRREFGRGPRTLKRACLLAGHGCAPGRSAGEHMPARTPVPPLTLARHATLPLS